jgi:hypothetical protein
MRLREFIMILGSAAVWPRVAIEPSAALLAAFKQRFQELSWTDGRNVRFEYLTREE